MKPGPAGGRSRADLSLWRQVRGYVRDPRVSVWKKASGVAAAVYLISPIDFVPDVLPIIGWLDDLGVVSAVAWFLVRDIRKHARTTPAPPGKPRDPG